MSAMEDSILAEQYNTWASKAAKSLTDDDIEKMRQDQFESRWEFICECEDKARMLRDYVWDSFQDKSDEDIVSTALDDDYDGDLTELLVERSGTKPPPGWVD